MRLQDGWGSLGGRGYSKPAIIQYPRWDPSVVEQPTSYAEITITTPSGHVVGKIRSDCQKSIIEQIEFTIDEHGCSNFKLKLNTLPPFPMFPFSIITIKIGNTRYNWYSGEISFKDDDGLSDDAGYEFSGVGLRNYLKTLKSKTTYPVWSDIGEIVQDLVQTWIVPYCPIQYNASKVDSSTGVILANEIELSSMPIETILNTLSDMAGCDWGVDGDKDLYFLPRYDWIERTFFVGYMVNTFKPKWNLTEVKNVITVQRQQGAGSGGVGWAVAGVYNDASSVKKYGRKELNYQIPGYFHDEEADIIGNALLAEKKEPSMSSTISGFIIHGGNEFLQRGNYRFVMPFGEYFHVYDDLDDVALWTAGNDVTITKDTTEYVYGDGSIKITFNGSPYIPGADLATIVKTFNLGKITSIRFFIQTSELLSGLKISLNISSEIKTIAFIDYGNSELRTYRFNGFTWSQVGSGLSITSFVYPAFAALNGTDIAFMVGEELRTYHFDGSTWYQIGSGLSIPGASSPALAALNDTDIAYFDGNLDSLRTYRFNGSTWSLVGSGLSIGGAGAPALAALNSVDVAFIDGNLDSLRTYRFNGSTWSLVGSGLLLGSAGAPALAALNDTDVAFIDTTQKELRTYHFNGSTWSQIGSGLSIPGTGTNFLALAALSETDVAFVDRTNDELRTYRFNGSIWSLVGSGLLIGGMDIPALAYLDSAKIFDINVPVKEKFVNVEYDLSNDDIRSLLSISISSDDVIDSGTEILLDRIELSVLHHKHYTMRLDNAKYKFSPTDQSATVEFGKIPPKMENYLAGLFATATELKFVQEIL
jgi:hypothetical protein